MRAPADVLRLVDRCTHSLAIEHLLKESNDIADLIAHLSPTPELRNARFGDPGDIMHVDVPFSSAASAIVSVCFDEGICGRTMFVADADRVFGCMVHRYVRLEGKGRAGGRDSPHTFLI